MKRCAKRDLFRCNFNVLSPTLTVGCYSMLVWYRIIKLYLHRNLDFIKPLKKHVEINLNRCAKWDLFRYTFNVFFSILIVGSFSIIQYYSIEPSQYNWHQNLDINEALIEYICWNELEKMHQKEPYLIYIQCPFFNIDCM